MPVDADTFPGRLGSLPAGVAVVTTFDAQGRSPRGLAEGSEDCSRRFATKAENKFDA